MKEKELKKGNNTNGNAASSVGVLSAKILVPVILAVLAVVIVILICIESTMGNKLVISNKSGHKIAFVELWYEYGEGDNEGEMLTEGLRFSGIEPKSKFSQSILPLELGQYYMQAVLALKVRFEDGGEVELQTSQFLNHFQGKLLVEFSDTSENEMLIRLKAGEGLFNSSSRTDCDDYYYINPKEGYVVEE